MFDYTRMTEETISGNVDVPVKAARSYGAIRNDQAYPANVSIGIKSKWL